MRQNKVSPKGKQTVDRLGVLVIERRIKTVNRSSTSQIKAENSVWSLVELKRIKFAGI